MKLIVAGTRTYQNYDYVEGILNRIDNISEIVCGGADGVDALGERYAKEHSIPITYFRADWQLYGKSAGPIRNKQMAEYGDKLIAFWNKKSPGTKNMVYNMQILDKPYDIYVI